MSLEVANEFIGGILTKTMSFVQGWSRYDLWGDPLMSERDDKWGIWEFDFESTHLDETGSKDWLQKNRGINWVWELEGQEIGELS